MAGDVHQRPLVDVQPAGGGRSVLAFDAKTSPKCVEPAHHRESTEAL
jgi:hypothetical protein